MYILVIVRKCSRGDSRVPYYKNAVFTMKLETELREEFIAELKQCMTARARRCAAIAEERGSCNASVPFANRRVH